MKSTKLFWFEKNLFSNQFIFKTCGVQIIDYENHVIENITKIISLENASGSFVVDDPKLQADGIL